jgi:hypothetical protein
MNNSLRTLSLFFVLLFSLLLAACGGGGGGDSSAGSGTLSVSLTDAPACGFDAVNVTVSKVRVHQSAGASENDAGWADITLNPARKINLLSLTNGALESLGQTPLRAGHYTQLRLVLVGNSGNMVANSVVLSGTTTEVAIDTPSAVQSCIKLINEFDVAAGQRVDLVLDFDAGKSIVTRGNGTYALKPVIQIIPTVLNGIDGFIDTALLGSHMMVSAQQNGVVIRSTSPNTTTGEFFLARLPTPGNYDVIITADGRATAVIAAVPVPSTTSTVMISTNAAPITLPTSAAGTISGTVTLNPTSATEVANVAAKQTFAGGPTVTVNSQFVDLLGGYSLSLPVGAPLLGSYGAGILPITLSAQSTVAGKYNVEASASGYVTQSAAKDITSANATQDFTLTP